MTTNNLKFPSLKEITASYITNNSSKFEEQIKKNSSVKNALFGAWDALKEATCPTLVDLYKIEVKQIKQVKEGLSKETVEKLDPADLVELSNPVELFNKLAKKFDKRGFSLQTYQQYEPLQIELKKKNDHALEKIAAIHTLPFTSLGLTKADQIRDWLYDPTNADTIKNAKDIFVVDVDPCFVPMEIALFKELENLILSDCKMQILPPYVFKLNKLRDLNISSNQINKIPNDIKKLSALYILNLCLNQIEELQPEFFDLPNLYNLKISRNKIKNLPLEITKLNQLKTLDVSSNPLQVVPSSILKMKSLEVLWMFESQIQNIPKEIANMTALKVLKLAWNKIQMLPLELFELKNLKELDLGYNRIQELPSQIFQLENLEELFVSGNDICSLPKELLALKKLTLFSLADNPILFVPNEILKSDAFNYATVITFFKHDLNYSCTSPLGKLYQSIIHQESHEEILTFFDHLPQKDKNLIFEAVWILAGSPMTEDHRWGEHHVLDDPIRFYKAVKKSISLKLGKLNQDEKNQVYGNAYKLLGSPNTEDPQCGEHAVMMNLALLADALGQ